MLAGMVWLSGAWTVQRSNWAIHITLAGAAFSGAASQSVTTTLPNAGAAVGRYLLCSPAALPDFPFVESL